MRVRTLSVLAVAAVALDVRDGKAVWRAYPIPEEPALMGTRPDGGESWGPSDGAIWSAPTIDAIVAFDLKTGAMPWSQPLAFGVD